MGIKEDLAADKDAKIKAELEQYKKSKGIGSVDPRPINSPSLKAGAPTQNVPQTDLGKMPMDIQESASRLRKDTATGVRNVIEGIAALPNMVGDSLLALANLTLPEEYQSKSSFSERFKKLMDKLAPEDKSLMGEISKSLASAMSLMGLGSSVGGVVGETLTSQPLTQLAGAATGTVASESAEKAGAGPIGQTAAGLVGGALPFGVNIPRIMAPGAKSEAARILSRTEKAAQEAGLSAQKSANIARAQELEGAAPGLELNLAARTGMPAEAGLVRGLTGPEATTAFDQNLVNNTKALSKYLDDVIPKGDIQNTVKALEKERFALTKASESAQSELEKTGLGFKSYKKPEELQAPIREIATAAKLDSSNMMGKLWDKVDKNVKFDTTKLEAKVEEVFKGVNTMLSDLSQVPQVAEKLKTGFKIFDEKVGGILTAQGLPASASKKIPRYMTTDEVAELNKTITSAARAVGQTDRDLSRRLYLLKDGIEGMVADAATGPGAEGAKGLKNFWDSYKKLHVERFYKGSTKEVLAKTGGDYKVKPSNIADKYFVPGKNGSAMATDFKATFQNDANAESIMKEYIRDKFYRDVVDTSKALPNDAKINSWVVRHRDALDAFGMTNEFSNIASATNTYKAALQANKAFSSTALGKLLAADPNKIPEIIFAGKAPVKTAEMLVEKLKGSPEAMEGLQTEVGKYFQKSIKGLQEPLAAGQNIFSANKINNFIKQNEPVLKIIYPEKTMSAYRNVLDAIQRMSLETKTAKGLGSPTNELEQAGKLFFSEIPLLRGVFKRLSPILDTFNQKWKVNVGKEVLAAVYDPAKAQELRNISIELAKQKNDLGLKNTLIRYFGVQPAVSVAGVEAEEQ